MVEPQAAFKALADPTRRDILTMLGGRDMTIAEVAENFEMTRAGVKKHLAILSDGGLISVRAAGRKRINTLNPAGLSPVLDWLTYFDQFWSNNLNTLKQVIEKDIK